MLRQHRQLPDDLGQLAVALLGHGEGHLALGGCLGLGDVLVVERVLRAVRLQRFEGEDHVGGGDGPAVVPARLLAQAVGDGRMVRRMPHRFGEEPVLGRDLVLRLLHQRVVDERDAPFERALHAGDEEVEVVEGVLHAEPHQPAPRRLGVDVVELREAGRVFEVAHEREPVPPFILRRMRGGNGEKGRYARGEEASQAGLRSRSDPRSAVMSASR
jgi:hypothetical protein